MYWLVKGVCSFALLCQKNTSHLLNFSINAFVSTIAMKLCTEECRVLGHSDQCWMPPLPSPASSDYRSNLYIPGEDPQQKATPEAPQSGESTLRKKSFSTFGKESEEGEGEAADEDDLCGTTSLLSEMNSVFQRLLPSSLDNYNETNEPWKGPHPALRGWDHWKEGRATYLVNQALPTYQQNVAVWGR